MYVGDHIAVSVAIAAVASRRFSLKFVPLAICLICVNLIDLDHLFYFHLDDGTANSLALHPLHIYSGIVISFVSIIALIDKERVLYYFAIVGAIAAHLASDSLAHFWHYHIPVLVIYACFRFAIIFFILRACITQGSYIKLFLFLIAQHIIASFITWFSSLYLAPQEDIMLYIIPHALLIVVTIVFWLLFKSKIEMRKTRVSRLSDNLNF